jgi:phenylacetate-CoA oxygenase PaaH subunit
MSAEGGSPRADPGGPGAQVAEGGSPRPDLEVFEVFRQEKEGGPMVHGGNLLAPDDELAAHYAREFYGRRQESVRLWVVRRSAIRDVADPDLLQPPMDRSFKKPAGYSTSIKQKLAEARERAGGPEGGPA